MLRFEPGGTINEHPGPNDTIVVCLEGEGMTSVAGVEAATRAGEQARRPRDVPHRLWTVSSPMVTLMVERTAPSSEGCARLLAGSLDQGM